MFLAKQIIAIFLFTCLIAFLVFLGFTQTGRDATDRSIEKMSESYQSAKNYIKEKTIELFEERKEIVEEEIEKEKESIEENIKETSRSIFSRIGDLIFNLPFLSRE